MRHRRSACAGAGACGPARLPVCWAQPLLRPRSRPPRWMQAQRRAAAVAAAAPRLLGHPPPPACASLTRARAPRAQLAAQLLAGAAAAGPAAAGPPSAGPAGPASAGAPGCWLGRLQQEARGGAHGAMRAAQLPPSPSPGLPPLRTWLPSCILLLAHGGRGSTTCSSRASRGRVRGLGKAARGSEAGSVRACRAHQRRRWRWQGEGGVWCARAGQRVRVGKRGARIRIHRKPAWNRMTQMKPPQMSMTCTRWVGRGGGLEAGGPPAACAPRAASARVPPPRPCPQVDESITAVEAIVRYSRSSMLAQRHAYLRVREAGCAHAGTPARRCGTCGTRLTAARCLHAGHGGSGPAQQLRGGRV